MYFKITIVLVKIKKYFSFVYLRIPHGGSEKSAHLIIKRFITDISEIPLMKQFKNKQSKTNTTQHEIQFETTLSQAFMIWFCSIMYCLTNAPVSFEIGWGSRDAASTRPPNSSAPLDVFEIQFNKNKIV